VTPPIPRFLAGHAALSSLALEREIADLFGIARSGHPDPRRLVRHAFWPADWFPLRKDAPARGVPRRRAAVSLPAVGGEGVVRDSGGPVHAGIIEPGHFRSAWWARPSST